jgi:Protein of unknown function (DUF4435)
MNLTKSSAKEEVDFMRDEAFKDKKILAITVEGKDDVAFWSFVFDRSQLNGKYQIFKSYQYPSADSSGKLTLAHFLPYTQTDFAICIDSDYDYLLENPVWQRPFVFQTYTYSIENYYCYVPSLNAVVNRAANIPLNTVEVRNPDSFGEGVSFEEIFIHQFSQIIYELTVESLQEAINIGRSEEPRRNLGRNIRLSGQSIEAKFSNLTVHVQNQIQGLLINDEFRNSLTDKGLTPETAYLFVRGHDVLNSAFLPILKLFQETFRRQKLSELSTIADNNLRKSSEKAYRMSVISVQTCLTENRNFTDCFLFQKIENDIRFAFQ